MEQFSKFCRTLLPADPFQAMLLLGVVLISFSRQLGWYSRPLVFKYTQSTNALHRFESFMIFAVLLTVFAGCAGYFVCFWPGKHPARRTIVTVLLPAFAGLVLVFYNYTSLVAPTVSVLYRKRSYFVDAAAIAGDWKIFPTAFYTCLLGAILVFLFLLRHAAGRTILPISFAASYDKGELRPGFSRRISILIFSLLAFVFFTSCIASVLGYSMLLSRPSPTSDALSRAIQSVFLLLVAFIIVGSEGLKSVRDVLRFPTARFLGWSCGIGIALGFLVPVLRYLYERAHWAAFDFGRLSPPEFSDVTLRDSWLAALGLIVVAICEEIVLRGLIQPKLLDRFGMHRGIIFAAAIWGAYEFHFYSFARHSIADLLVSVGIFFGTHLALSYLYAWAYLKSDSIIPAIMLHAILNLSTLFRIELDFPGARFARPVVWAVGTLLLFRLWPVVRRIAPAVEIADADPSPAT